MSIAVRLYRALLHLYPAGFLADYRSELVAAFSDRAAASRGPFGSAGLVGAALVDVVPNAAAAHWEMLRRDVGYALRSLRRSVGFTVTAVLLIALGVGANTAAFSLADYVLLRPLPYPRGDRLVKLWERTADYGRNELSPAVYRDWAAASTASFSSFGAFTLGGVNLVGTAEPHRLAVARVTPNVLPTVGVPAMVGRVISAEDSVGGGVAVISYALWRGEFGGATDVVGRVIRLDGAAHTIVGVMPPSFQFPNREVDVWTPLLLAADDFTDRTDTYLQGIARLRDGVTFEQAREQLTAAATRIEAQYASGDDAITANVFRLRDELSSRARMLLLALCGAALCILLLACANLGGLLLARTAHRGRELAVRAALGGARERLVRQLVTESLTLVALGGVIGVAAALAGVPLLARLVPNALPVAERPSADPRVIVAALVAVAVAALLFGVAPALRTTAQRTLLALREGGRSGGGQTQRLRAALVIAEVAASVVLLASCGLLVRAVLRIQSADPGFRAEGVVALTTALPLPEYGATAKRTTFYTQVLQRVRTLPGVKSAAYVTGLPMRMTGGVWKMERPGSGIPADQYLRASARFVTPEYFATLGIPLLRGRDVTDQDSYTTPPVAVISESAVRRYWPNEDPIGRRFTVMGKEHTVVGVVKDVRVRGREITSEPQMYFSSQQVDDNAVVYYAPKDLVVRTTGPAAALVPALRAAVRAADPNQPISDVGTLADVVSAETAPRVTQVRLLSALSIIALLIAGVGVHGLLTFSVSRRTQELAVRRALGAEGRAIVRMVLVEGVGLAAVGVVIGLVGAYLAARTMGALLAGIQPSDPLTAAAVAALCIVTVIVGCLRPAVRAARISPQSALRAE